jgi:hypothetical protein
LTQAFADIEYFVSSTGLAGNTVNVTFYARLQQIAQKLVNVDKLLETATKAGLARILLIDRVTRLIGAARSGFGTANTFSFRGSDNLGLCPPV